ncbi:class I SAM-dependent methyltransferase [Rhodovarius crocodyli]|uniref:Class I SAM-dependent methyltransferase n=1 Tax=Rhodovarius crocodyli TaxID=1979269 RepID=A0A437MNU5_9PROT|nr:class I SAM-dependent methyltransferase [Rhodovarius crocodyli]RVT99313.1 class I SAM-dependent methyltransferase [Rhodovarius crocodyli]
MREIAMRAGTPFATTPCRLCGGTEREVLATRGRGFTPLTTVLCTGCGLVSHHPLPSAEETAAFYATRYRLDYKGGWEPKRKHALRAVRGALARAARLAPLLPAGGRVLDIGASSGELVHVMGRMGFRARGIEPNLGYAEFARRTYGAEVESGGFETLKVMPGSLDLVTLNHVLEHLADPWGALRLAHRWLAGDGLLFLEVPDLSATRKQAANLFHTAHIWNFTPETLALLAWRCGFTVMQGRGTSLVLRKWRPDDEPPTGADAALAARLRQLVTSDSRPLAYLLSGSPVRRRVARLRRNIDEYLVCRRHDCIREMADAVIAAAARG